MELYTEDSPLYRNLNKALRSNSINSIYACRTVICDLHSYLRNQQQQHKNSSDCRCFYRGQFVDTEEIEQWKNNIGCAFCIKSFWSASRKKSVAKIFAGDGQWSHESRIQSVVFVIKVNKQLIHAIHADSTVESEEEEHVFSSRSLFRVDKVKQIRSVWCVHLTLIDQNDEQVRLIIEPYKNILGEYFLYTHEDEQSALEQLHRNHFRPYAFRLLLHFILRLDRNDYALAEFLDYFRTYCEKRDKINAFDGFRSLYFDSDRDFILFERGMYTHNAVSAAMKNGDIDALFKMRYFIRGLFNGLEQTDDDEEDDSSEENSDEDPLRTFYRGQIISRFAFNKFQKNKTRQITFSKFLWTTTDFDTAVYNASEFDRTSCNQIPVILKITVDTKLSYPTSFRQVERAALFPLNDDIVFPPNCVFDIVTIEKCSKIWIIHLSLSTQENDEKWKMLSEHV
ncbi:unnamed protein product [Adineta steineri]|uniref:NAD(P)(+)--arginine ADP-ribosyltransferase n=1 Tax=Adineta steineri TaxID=433720 RepID=A0A813Q1Z1_9BILA|nr:unnamed protein product [Adineta steineri]CAF0758651.1 unnamed protein product [Adineta steineri]CAF0831915.1 unnamed protein product [Adineta steineri]CAF3837130.1 unnamed protein product [Adineta steineri]CAF3892631.1 unnamed protein product [Adineta steineri]